MAISTHSLTRRLTRLGTSCLIKLFISTHSLTRRLTVSMLNILTMAIFQLTASQGGWRRIWIERYFLEHFNSQPHKEADKCKKSRIVWFVYFNSQPHKEADSNAVVEDVRDYLFQLTASQGGWRFCKKLIKILFNYFNSQPHKEADIRV